MPNPKTIIRVLGVLTTVVAVAQLFPYAIWLRLSAFAGAVEYIWAFTFLGCLNFVYIWHNCRLIFMLQKNKFSHRSVSTSKVWFYAALLYLVVGVLQSFWWFYLDDSMPMWTAVANLPFSTGFFITATRRIHKLKNSEGIELVSSPAAGQNS